MHASLLRASVTDKRERIYVRPGPGLLVEGVEAAGDRPQRASRIRLPQRCRPADGNVILRGALQRVRPRNPLARLATSHPSTPSDRVDAAILPPLPLALPALVDMPRPYSRRYTQIVDAAKRCCDPCPPGGSPGGVGLIRFSMWSCLPWPCPRRLRGRTRLRRGHDVSLQPPGLVGSSRAWPQNNGLSLGRLTKVNVGALPGCHAHEIIRKIKSERLGWATIALRRH